MAMKNRHCFLLLLIIAVAMQASSIAPIGGGSGAGCIICESGYKCENGMCVKDPCQNDCSNTPYSPLCASSGVTYDNTCEYEKDVCLNDLNMVIIYYEPCVTTPPRPENLCKNHQKRIASVPAKQYNEMCDYQAITSKANSGTLRVQDVIDCYDPTCKGKNYFILQCSYNAPKWCWCADVKGIAIPGTFRRGLKESDCILRDSCVHERTTFLDGELFIQKSGCGLCECLDGNVTCFEDYVPSTTGQLNKEQLLQLKDELVQLFYFQYNHEDHVLIDIRHIHQHPTTISDNTRRTVLGWKFEHYDRNGDGGLSSGEQWLIEREIDQFVHCSSFFDHVAGLMNGNNDGVIVIREWESFFGVDLPSGGSANGGLLAPVKRSASINPDPSEMSSRFNSLEKRKRFYYVLV